MKLLKTAIVASGTLFLATALHSQSIVQTNPDYLAFDATSYSGGVLTNWTALTDNVTSPSVADQVMVFADTDGVDASSVNTVGDGSDTLTWTLDFTNAADYSLFIRVQGEFLGSSVNDSIFFAKNWDAVPTSIGNSLGNTDLSANYQWVRLTVSASDPLGMGVGGYSSGADWGLTIDATQAVSSTTVTYSIAGREGDLQLDQVVFHTNPSVTAAQLDALVGIEPEPAHYLIVDATDYSSAGGTQWAAFTDKTTSPSFADQVMIFGDSLGVDASNANVPVGVSSVDTLTYTLDFTSAGDYSVFVRVQGEFGGASTNDSLFYAKSFGGPSTSTANSLAPGSNLSTDYAWVRLTYDADASAIPAPGSGIESYSPSSSADWLPLTINSTQALSGNTVTYTIAGRERDLQLDLIVFHTNPAVSGAELDALAAPAPSASISISQTVSGLEIEYTGTLQESSDLSGWTDVDPQPASPWTITLSPSEKRFFQATD